MDRDEYRQAYKQRKRERERESVEEIKLILDSHCISFHDQPFILISSLHLFPSLPLPSLLFSSLLFAYLYISRLFYFLLFSLFFLSSFLISLTGSELSMVDVMFAPFLERMAASLPYYKGFIVRGERSVFFYFTLFYLFFCFTLLYYTQLCFFSPIDMVILIFDNEI